MRFGDRSRPIGRQLPLLITVLLSTVVVVFAWMAYRALTSALLAAAGVRVVSVSQRLAVALGEPEARLRREGTPLSRDTALRRVLLRPDAATRVLAQGLLDAERAKNAQVTLVELWNTRGARALGFGALDGSYPLGAAEMGLELVEGGFHLPPLVIQGRDFCRRCGAHCDTPRPGDAARR